ncbi:YcxB family protein [Winogradskyella endarachnes]|uniref:YcxB-like C-terminal domain-containing protein n=1 Tax=Winogradskyella endarachnes TaxID=2681965 RepID=A0A6L6U6Z6_9FLAO|nr:YcxB family protein [Winogradskyella endarachnes]MUU77356.1 hypothetical protein [Winogradskyella endarachnes]
MNLKYDLSFSDFLEYQLYFSSKSKVQQKNRKKSRIIVPIIYAVLILIAILIGNYILAITFAIIAIIWYLIHPVYAKYRYKKHFENHIKENYKNRIDKEISLTFNQNSRAIEGIEEGTQSTINYSEFDVLIEIKEHFFLKLKSNVSFIIPKRAIDDLKGFKKIFTDINIEIVDQTDWIWK